MVKWSFSILLIKSRIKFEYIKNFEIKTRNWMGGHKGFLRLFRTHINLSQIPWNKVVTKGFLTHEVHNFVLANARLDAFYRHYKIFIVLHFLRSYVRFYLVNLAPVFELIFVSKNDPFINNIFSSRIDIVTFTISFTITNNAIGAKKRVAIILAVNNDV